MSSGCDRTALHRRELGNRRAQGVELRLDELLGDVHLLAADLELRPVGQLGLRLHGERGGELPVLVTRRGKLEVVLRLLDGTEPRACRRVPEPAADVGLDGLRHQPLLADALEQHLARHLPLAEARDLDARGEVVGGVLDGVMNVVGRHLDRQANAVLRELFDGGVHMVIQAGNLWPRSNVPVPWTRGRSSC